MSPSDAILAALRDLGKRLETDMTPDEHGVLTLDLGDDCHLTLELPPHSPTLCLHAPVLRLAPGRREPTMERALRLNLFDSEAPICWIALDAETDQLLLCSGLDARGMDADGLAEILNAFADNFALMRRRLLLDEGAAASNPFVEQGLIRG